jgi:hypothetical protein
MYDYQTFKLVHLHDGERITMEERGHEDAADHDPERGWVEGARIFRCGRCAEEVVVMPPGHDEPAEPR